MQTHSTTETRVHLIRLNPGDDVLLELQEWANTHSIHNAAFVSGVGSLTSYHAHVVETTNLPPGNIFFKGEGAYDILAITGHVLDGRVHAHITWSDDKIAMGGHLEEGCNVLTFCLITAIEVPSSFELGNWDSWEATF